MQYLSLLHTPLGGPDAVQSPPPPELMDAIMALGQEAGAAGVLVTQAGLLPSEHGARLVLADDGISIADGPFAETKELVSYSVWDCRDLAEAVEWSRRFLALHQDTWPGWTGEVSIQPLFVPPLPEAQA